MRVTKTQWAVLVKKHGPRSFNLAQDALSNLVGYRKTSLRRVDDEDSLTSLIEAIREDERGQTSKQTA